MASQEKLHSAGQSFQLAIQNDWNLYFSSNDGTFGQIPFLGGQAGANQLAIGSGPGTFAISTLPNCTASGCVLNYNNATQGFAAHLLASPDIPNNAASTTGQAGSLAGITGGNPVTATNPFDFTTNPFESDIPNAPAGTSTGSMVKFINTSGTQQVTKTAITDTTGFGCVQSGAGTSGTANVAWGGQGQCLFDNVAITANDYVIVSPNMAGTLPSRYNPTFGYHQLRSRRGKSFRLRFPSVWTVRGDVAHTRYDWLRRDGGK